MFENIEIRNISLLGDQESALSLRLVNALGHDAQTLKARRGLSPVIDNIASSQPIVGIERLFSIASRRSSLVGIWAGEQPESIGFFVATPDVAVYRKQHNSEPGKETEIFHGTILDSYAHLDAKEVKHSKVKLDDVLRSLYSFAGKVATDEFGEDVAVLERTSPPTGRPYFVGGRNSVRFFKNADSRVEQAMTTAIVGAGFTQSDGSHYHFRHDSNFTDGIHSKLFTM